MSTHETSESIFILLIVMGVLMLFIFGVFKCGVKAYHDVEKRVVLEVKL